MTQRPGAEAPAIPALQAREQIERSIPAGVADRDGWVSDMYASFDLLAVAPTREHICAVVAEIEQESGFRVDPVIPHLGSIAWAEIDRRAQSASIPPALVHSVLQLKSPSGRSYADRIDSARTEHELSDILEDFTGSLPLGRTLFASWNPIRTRGPMQVNIAFAQKFAQDRPYPYPVAISVADEVFTRRGSLYFGIAHLLDYQAPYDHYLYRFADFNAGQYASRNAAFQSALGIASHQALLADGALLPGAREGHAAGDTEMAAHAIAGRLKLDDAEIHDALEQGRSANFEKTALYQRVFALANRVSGRTLPAAVVPRIKLQGPKITRALTTDWYAHRVNERFESCLAQ